MISTHWITKSHRFIEGWPEPYVETISYSVLRTMFIFTLLKRLVLFTKTCFIREDKSSWPKSFRNEWLFHENTQDSLIEGSRWNKGAGKSQVSGCVCVECTKWTLVFTQPCEYTDIKQPSDDDYMEGLNLLVLVILGQNIFGYTDNLSFY